MRSLREETVATRPSRLAGGLRAARSKQPVFIMAVLLLVLGFFLIYPILLMAVLSFNTAPHVFLEAEWGLDNWRIPFEDPRVFQAIANSFLIWIATVGIAFPIATLISWVLARTNIPFSHGLEFLFWVSYLMPGISVVLAWIFLLDPNLGYLNALVELLPFVDEGPFNIFSVPGIIWAGLMTNGISTKVMLMTPAFRNMDQTLEEVARIAGASTVATMFRVTLPLMVSPMALVFALQLVRVFQSFEIEQLLGVPFGFFVYSTLIYDFARQEAPQYAPAMVLGLITTFVIVLIVPLQRWILQRRRYTTITGQFRPGLIDLGRWRYPLFLTLGTLLFLLTIGPGLVLLAGSFMVRAGFWFHPLITTHHWEGVLTDARFLGAVKTTLVLAVTAAVLSPVLFSIIAYILVRTRWAGRSVLDFIIWGSAVVPGMLSGLGLLMVVLGTPIIGVLYGTVWILIIIVVLQGNTTGVNISKAAIVQVGFDMEEAARVSGAGWLGTYFRIWVPLLAPTLVLLSTMNFVMAAGATSSLILLVSFDNQTLSILALLLTEDGKREAASIVGLAIIIVTTGMALIARHYGLQLGVSHHH